MPGTKLKERSLITKGSTTKAKSYIDASQDPDTPFTDADCPWVQVGSVYASITVTGDESWLPLLRLLRDRGRKHFVVFT